MQIYKQLTSPDQTLPWEDGRLTPKDMRRLGVFRKPIMQLLQRDPNHRASALQFCKQMSKIFNATAAGSVVGKDAMPPRW